MTTELSHKSLQPCPTAFGSVAWSAISDFFRRHNLISRMSYRHVSFRDRQDRLFPGRLSQTENRGKSKMNMGLGRVGAKKKLNSSVIPTWPHMQVALWPTDEDPGRSSESIVWAWKRRVVTWHPSVLHSDDPDNDNKKIESYNVGVLWLTL